MILSKLSSQRFPNVPVKPPNNAFQKVFPEGWVASPPEDNLLLVILILLLVAESSYFCVIQRLIIIKLWLEDRKKCWFLNKLLNPERSELLLVTGRRRVGKSHLIRENFKENICVEFVGTQYGDTGNQLQKFALETKNLFLEKYQNVSLTNWSVAFRHLSNYVESLKKKEEKSCFFRWIFMDCSTQI